MLYSLRTKLNRAWFDFACRGVFDTPPVRCDPESPLLILSQSLHRDMVMLLLSLKSCARYVSPREFVIVDDGLTEVDRQHLKDHLGNVRFQSTDGIDTGPCPRGGTWERLLTIIDLSKDSYVIQLDSDTLSLAELSEVAACVHENRSFTLGTWLGQRIVSFDEASRMAKEAGASDHVQSKAEIGFSEFPDKDSRRYVRGCSGFAGFARGQFSRRDAEEFSRRAAAIVGDEKWKEWGSEQVASNYLVANAPGAVVLPVPKYTYFDPTNSGGGPAFLHFLGTYRFSRSVYRTLGEHLIKELRDGATSRTGPLSP